MRRIRHYARSARHRGTDFIRAGLACLLIIACMLASPGYALTVPAYGFDEVIERADIIVIGTVRETRSAWDASGQTIVTRAVLDELELLKGEVPASVYELEVPGGVVGDAAQVYPGIPVLLRGERYVLFIRGDRQHFIPFVGAYQGVYSVLRSGGEEHVFRYDQAPEPGSAIGVQTAPDAPTLDEFVRRIVDHLDEALDDSP